MNRLTFTIEGTPLPWKRAQSKGKQRFTDASTRDAKARVARCAVVAMAAAGLRAPMEGALAMRIDTHRRRKVTATPDWDNLGKLVSDALNGIAYTDDAQVVEATVRKHDVRRGEGDERTEVTIWALETPRKARSIEPTNASLPARRAEPCPMCAVVNGHFGSCPGLGR